MTGGGPAERRRRRRWRLSSFSTAFFYRFNTLGGALGGFTQRRVRLPRAGASDSGRRRAVSRLQRSGLVSHRLPVGGGAVARRVQPPIRGAADRRHVVARRGADVPAGASRGGVDGRGARRRGRVTSRSTLVTTTIRRSCCMPRASRWRGPMSTGRRLRAALRSARSSASAFLFRHDHLVYLGALVADDDRVRAPVVDRATACARQLACAGRRRCFVVPFLVFLALNGGVVEYFRAALVYVARDARAHELLVPAPFARFLETAASALSRERADPSARINVRWNPVSEEERRDARGSLGAAERRSARRHDLDVSSFAIRLAAISKLSFATRSSTTRRASIRTAFALSGEPRRLTARDAARHRAERDGVPVLRDSCCSLSSVQSPLWRLRGAAVATRVLSSPAHLVPAPRSSRSCSTSGFLSRGSTNIRIPDVGVTAADTPGLARCPLSRAATVAVARARASGLVCSCARGSRGLLFLTVLSANGLAQGITGAATTQGSPRVPSELVTRARVSCGTGSARTRARSSRTRSSRAFSGSRASSARARRPDDRLFVLGEHPELYYFADRRFAGGHAWLLPVLLQRRRRRGADCRDASERPGCRSC